MPPDVLPRRDDAVPLVRHRERKPDKKHNRRVGRARPHQTIETIKRGGASRVECGTQAARRHRRGTRWLRRA